MRRDMLLSILTLLSLLLATLLGGCGSAKKEGVSQGAGGVALVGSQVCINCHATTLATDVTGEAITAAWSDPANSHTTVGHVECESCHGAGGNHWGVGPIPFPNPGPAQCEACHTDFTSFNTTAHNNQNQTPNSTFSQFFPPPAVPGTNITAGQHIQECSVCHNASQRIALDASGNINVPDPNNLPNPSVTCASCHDAHFAEKRQAIAQRTTTVPYPNFRQFFQNISGAQVSPGAQVVAGTPKAANQRGFIFQPNGAVLPAAGVNPGTTTGINLSNVSGGNNEIKPELLCAACHTKGTYKNSGGKTHQDNIYTQWTNSGHGTRSDAAFGEFSANPTFYDPAFPTGDGSHQSIWPFDMSLNNGFGTGTATTYLGASAMSPVNDQPGKNAAVGDGRGGFNNNFLCYKCHNGVTSLAWQDDVQGTLDAPVVFGDASVTCITCHDPHANVPGQTSNTRKPVLMTKYQTSFVTISGNVFLDTQPVPSTTGNATICLYCHQGRESGFTLYKNRLAPGIPLATLNRAFFNPHYLGTGAMLWGANAYEYTGKSYSVNAAHQGANCTTCHMANPSDNNLNGGHSWNPNVVSCNTSSCHGGAVGPSVSAEGVTASPDVDNYRAAFDTNDYDGDGSGESIALQIKHLQDKVIALLAANGIYYDDLNYPYVFNDPVLRTTAAQFTTWGSVTGGTNAYKAAFNLQFIIKGLPSAATTQTLVPNASAAVHNYKYAIQLLRDSYDDYNAVAPVKGAALGGVRPVGTRAATVYGPGQ